MRLPFAIHLFIMPEKPPKPETKKRGETKSPHSHTDSSVWQEYCQNITPLENRHKFPDFESVSKDLPPQLSEQKKNKKQGQALFHKICDEFPLGSSLVAPISLSEPSPSTSSKQTDKRLRERFQKGELPIDGRIDLHGLTANPAQRQFCQFLTEHIHSGSRCLLIITGKGRDPQTGQTGGILRQSLTDWINVPAFAPHILICQPAPRHMGGNGAFLILLRRQRS